MTELTEKITEVMNTQTGKTSATALLRSGETVTIKSDGTFLGQMLSCLAIKAAHGDLQATSIVLDLMRDSE